MGKNTKTSAMTAGKKVRTADNSKRKEDVNSGKQCLKKKKKKRFIPIKVKEENKSETLNKAFADFKPPKGTVSSNWLAFKTSGLYEETKKEHVDSKFKGKKRHPWRKYQEKTSDLSATKDVKAPQMSNADLPQDMTIEDIEIASLTPESDAEKKELTSCIAMDCEMVGVGDGKENILARISLVNQHGECIYDKFVKPKEEVIDYRTFVSGVRPSDLKKGEDFEVVQKEVASILSGRILVGHAIHNDLKVLLLNHPPRMIRDTSRFKPFRNMTQGRLPGLKKLAAEVLGVTIQTGEHSSVEDAKATMQLYNLYQKEWEDHRLQRKLLRKKKAIEAAVSSSKVVASKKSQKLSRPKKNPHMDEFVAF